jgi:type IV pilus assembly protein PilC
VAYFSRWRKTDKGREILDRAVLRAPLKVGDVVRKVALARFARTLGVLSAAGVPILQAMEVTAVSSGNRVVEEAVMRSRRAVRDGAPIHEPLAAEPVFPPMVTRMIAVGEETGNLDAMLAKVAEFYEAEVEATVDALTSIIEPLMIVVVGAIVGGIIIAMYLPMFRVFELVG